MRTVLQASSCVLLLLTSITMAQGQIVESSLFGATVETQADGTYKVTVTPGDFPTDAMLVSSQPSNTLLVAVIDSNYKITAEGQALDATIQGAPGYVEGDLSQITPTVLLAQGPPALDDRIQVLLYGTFDGTELVGVQAINTGINGTDAVGVFAVLQKINGILSFQACCKCSGVDCGCIDDCLTPLCDCVECSITCN